MRTPLIACLSLFVPSASLAWPVDLYVDLEPGAEKFHRLAEVSWLEVEDPEVAKAEVMESGELMLSGVTPGRTLLLLYAQGRFALWRIRVAPKGQRPTPLLDSAALAEAKRACPGLVATAGDEPSLTATVKDERCRSALLGLLRTDAYQARQLELTFGLPALQSQLGALEKALPKGAAARYRGAGLELSGKLSPEAHRRALWALFREAAGRVVLEDRVELDRPKAE
ncbi:MAG: pilus assembly protein N-terminal domain-containing protein [Myxococcales bacterium]|nr:pilus assembly protein N-terminal domain-containing protein [Myxococcales bacterium]